MNDECDDETVHIVGDPSEALHFFQKILDDASILERIPKGAAIDIVSRPSGEQDAGQSSEDERQAIESFEIGDQIVYILEVPAHVDAAN